VKEGTQAGENILNLLEAFDFEGNIQRHFKLQKGDEIVQVTDDGQVLLRSLLDREQLCGSEEACIFKSTIAVLPQSVYEKIALEIIVDDVNDNAPRFSKKSVSVEISESVLPKDRIEVQELRASDFDVGNFGKISYEVIPGGKFEVSEDEFRTFLVPLQKLDRESEKSWTGTVIATDGGGREDRTKLEVIIIDENDNAPQFTGSKFQASVTEGQPAGTFIYQVEAKDLDLGENSEIKYSILKVKPISAGKIFSIDEISGSIKTTQQIDREEFESVILTVEARDQGDVPLRSYCEVSVAVLDKNDHKPSIILTPIEESGSFAIVNESEKAGTFVAFVSVEDLDSGQNSQISVTVAPTHLFTVEEEDGGDFVVKTRVPFDREQKEFYNLTVKACDNGKPTLCAEQSQQIKIGDINDNRPIFNKIESSLKIDENIAIGTILIQIKATDADDDQNFGKVRYRLVGSDHFEIDQNTGVIRVAKNIDYELQTKFNLTIIAEDGGGLTTSKPLMVFVENLNDNTPEITVPEIVYLEKNALPGQAIFSFEVSDADGTTPDLSLEGPDAEKFKIEENRIILDTNVTNDFKAKLILVATDAENPSTRVLRTVKISLAINYAAVGAGVACGVLFVILVLLLLVFYFCPAKSRDKFQHHFNSLRQRKNQRTPDAKFQDYSRADMIISDATGKLMKPRGSDGSLDHVIGSAAFQKVQRRNDSDSGRGESESETHSRNHHVSFSRKKIPKNQVNNF